jgi:hypothetical protein
MRVRPLRPLGIAIVLLIAMSLQPALADVKTVRDRRNVAANPFDIQFVKADHRGSLLRHTIRTYRAWRSGELRSTRRKPRVFCLYVWTGGAVQKRKPEYQICATFRKGKLRASLFEAGSKRRVQGGITVKRPDRRSVSFSFGPETIGDPASYHWQGVTGYTGKGCPRDPPFQFGCDDSAPTKKAEVHELVPESPVPGTTGAAARRAL